MKTRKDARSGLTIFLENLLSDYWRKLLALGIAILVWLGLDAQVTDRATAVVTLRAVDGFRGSGATVDASGADFASVLEFVLPVDGYSVVRFEDPIRSERRDTITLSLAGPKHLVDLLNENPGFTVTPEKEEFEVGLKFVEFDIGRVRPRLPELKRVMVGMEPRRVRVVIEPKATRTNSIMPDLIDIRVQASPDAENFQQRLKNATYAFHPSEFVLSGTEAALNSIAGLKPLFRADVQFDARSNEEVNVPLQLTPELLAAQIRLENSPRMRITLPPRMEQFEMNVPVQLDVAAMPGADPQQYVVEPTLLKVVLRAGNQLESDLSVRRNANELDAWARENVRMSAVLLRDVESNAPQLVTPRFYFLRGNWRDGRDYIVEPTSGVQVRRKE